VDILLFPLYNAIEEGSAMPDQQKPWAIYLRVSTKDQEKSFSPQTQLELCLGKARELGVDVPQQFIFFDDYSGFLLERPGLNPLYELVDNQAIGGFITLCADRLARDPQDQSFLRKRASRAGVCIVTVMEEEYRGLEGELVQFVRGWAAKQQIFGPTGFVARSLEGRKTRARSGKLPHGGGLYGYVYNKQTGLREVDPPKASVVVQIFEWYANEGLSTLGIAQRLNLDRVDAPKGKIWRKGQVQRILTHTAYKGEDYAFKYKAVPPKNPRKVMRRHINSRAELRPREEWIPIPTPSIVPCELWEKANTRLREHRGSPGRPQVYLLSGLLRCGRCGAAYHGHASKKPYAYYKCDGKQLGCNNRIWPKEELERKVFVGLASAFETDASFIEAVRKAEARHNPDRLRSQIKELEAMHMEYQKQRLRLIELYKVGVISQEEMCHQAGELHKQRERLEERKRQLEELLHKAPSVMFAEEDLKAFRELSRALMDADNFLTKLRGANIPAPKFTDVLNRALALSWTEFRPKVPSDVLRALLHMLIKEVHLDGRNARIEGAFDVRAEFPNELVWVPLPLSCLHHGG
jgi:site-specific DNA recombinase